jgi:hypothetical protein
MRAPTSQEIDVLTLTPKSPQEHLASDARVIETCKALAETEYLKLAQGAFGCMLDKCGREATILSVLANGIHVGMMAGYNQALRGVCGVKN